MKVLQLKTLLFALVTISLMFWYCELRNVKIIYDESLLMGFELDLSGIELRFVKGSTDMVKPVVQGTPSNEKQPELAANAEVLNLTHN